MERETNHQALAYLIQSRQLPFSAKMVSRTPPPVKVTSEREREYLRPKEVESLLNEAHSCGRHGVRDAAIILLMFRHGLRTAELVALKWSQIDLTDGYIEIKRAKHGHNSTHPLRAPELRALRQIKRDYPETQLEQLQAIFKQTGGVEQLLTECEEINAYQGNNYFPLLWRFYKSHRSAFFRVFKFLKIESTSNDDKLVKAVEILLSNSHRRGEWIATELDLSFISQQWQKLVIIQSKDATKVMRRHFEICIFSYLAAELKSGDICVFNSEAYADYREQLLSWQDCQPLVETYCQQCIRNWQDLVFYRPEKETVYQHIDSLFKGVINWELIATHWSDLLRVVISIKEGKVSSDMLLRKLGNYSRKNKLYQAFRELGRVIRTIFLLQFISDKKLRQQITAMTNKVEAYNGFSKWFCFGGEGVIASNNPEQQEKTIKYGDLVANAVIFHNVVDLTEVLLELRKEGFLCQREDLAALSPYLTRHIKRFGDYLIDLETIPPALEEQLNLGF